MKMLTITYARRADDGGKGKYHGGEKPKSGGK
jgi:N-methylhydantoinase B/oxoprolinase/acetone carboxylase alpha subunit